MDAKIKDGKLIVTAVGETEEFALRVFVGRSAEAKLSQCVEFRKTAPFIRFNETDLFKEDAAPSAEVAAPKAATVDNVATQPAEDENSKLFGTAAVEEVKAPTTDKKLKDVEAGLAKTPALFEAGKAGPGRKAQPPKVKVEVTKVVPEAAPEVAAGTMLSIEDVRAAVNDYINYNVKTLKVEMKVATLQVREIMKKVNTAATKLDQLSQAERNALAPLVIAATEALKGEQGAFDGEL